MKLSIFQKVESQTVLGLILQKLKKSLIGHQISLSDGLILLEDIDYWKEAPVWDEESMNNATKKWFEYLG